jgi:hypothetical protein
VDQAFIAAVARRAQVYKSVASFGRYFSKSGIIRMFLSRHGRPRILDPRSRVPLSLIRFYERTARAHNVSTITCDKVFLDKLVEFDNFIERMIFFAR